MFFLLPLTLMFFCFVSNSTRNHFIGIAGPLAIHPNEKWRGVLGLYRCTVLLIPSKQCKSRIALRSIVLETLYKLPEKRLLTLDNGRIMYMTRLNNSEKHNTRKSLLQNVEGDLSNNTGLLERQRVVIQAHAWRTRRDKRIRASCTNVRETSITPTDHEENETPNQCRSRCRSSHKRLAQASLAGSVETDSLWH